VSELERGLNTATLDLETTSRQFSKVTNQLQVAPKRRRGSETLTPSCRKTSTVSWMIPPFVLAPCRALTHWPRLQGHA
jgi:hypothetical protein